MNLLADRLKTVEERIAAACRRAGRARTEVTLVAVTKTVSPSVVQQLVDLGVRDLGENRPQELWRKAAAVRGEIRWHLVGHLQRNKIERTAPLVHLVHSVDSLRLLQALEQEAEVRGRPLEVLLECNASEEATKQGFSLGEVAGLVPALAELRHVHVRGLMTMAAFAEDPESCRSTFAALRHLCDTLRPRLTSPHRLDHLSMGMSNDFEVAIEEGATLIRLGTVLFEGLSEVRS
jgi:pyridoxal phosphate enzyme (YggS family)